ncbi:MAG: Fe-S cluster assembly ATPase SufC, partial [Candidatus Marinimicrobia bacterium CG_4_9_14_3_um_filter_48_9]
MLSIKNLQVSVEGNPILKGLNLEIKAGEIHAIMGPNGSGKSTLSHILAGRPGYEVTGGEVHYQGKNLFDLNPEERARAGIFLAFQYPIEIPGVNNTSFLKKAVNEIRKHHGQEELDAVDFLQMIKAKMKLVGMDPAFLRRPVNEGF